MSPRKCIIMMYSAGIVQSASSSNCQYPSALCRASSPIRAAAIPPSSGRAWVAVRCPESGRAAAVVLAAAARTDCGWERVTACADGSRALRSSPGAELGETGRAAGFVLRVMKLRRLRCRPNRCTAHTEWCRKRQLRSRRLKEALEQAIATQAQSGGHPCQPDSRVRYLDVCTARELRTGSDPAQRQHRKADSPQAESPHAALARRNQQGVGKRVAQVSVGHGDQLAQARVKAGVGTLALE